MNPLRRLWLLVRMTAKEAGRHAVHRSAGALAFFSLFGVPSAALILLVVGGAIFGSEALRTSVLTQVEAGFGPETRTTLESVFRNTPRPGEGPWPTQLFSIVVLLFGASLTFHQLQCMLNDIWDAPNRSGWWRFLAVVVKRLLTFVVLALTGLTLMIYLGVSMFLRAFPQEMAGILPPDVIAFVTGSLDSLLLGGLLVFHFAVAYKLLPDAHVPRRAAVLGATLAAVLFVIGKHVVEIYLHHRDLATAFGAAGSLVVTLVWVYAASLTTLIGAAFSRAYTRWASLNAAVARPEPA